MDVTGFYDGLAADYHLVYGGHWETAIERQGESLTRLIRSLRPDAESVLDCSCGIGTQAIGLAERGFHVAGTDLSPGAVERARTETSRRGLTIDFDVADFRHLDAVDGVFDVVLTADNALPHLLDDAGITQALTSMRSRLREDGLLLVSIRDYDRALVDRPPTAMPIVVAGPPRQVVVRLHEWDDGEEYTVRFLINREETDGWTVTDHATRYRAIRRDRLSAMARETGFRDGTWHRPEDVGFHQPIFTARRDEEVPRK